MVVASAARPGPRPRPEAGPAVGAAAPPGRPAAVDGVPTARVLNAGAGRVDPAVVRLAQVLSPSDRTLQPRVTRSAGTRRADGPLVVERLADTARSPTVGAAVTNVTQHNKIGLHN